VICIFHAGFTRHREIEEEKFSKHTCLTVEEAFKAAKLRNQNRISRDKPAGLRQVAELTADGSQHRQEYCREDRDGMCYRDQSEQDSAVHRRAAPMSGKWWFAIRVGMPCCRKATRTTALTPGSWANCCTTTNCTRSITETTASSQYVLLSVSLFSLIQQTRDCRISRENRWRGQRAGISRLPDIYPRAGLSEVAVKRQL
jgi:hypothetical protein